MVVSVPTFNSADPGSNPTDVNKFICKISVWKEQKRQKESGIGQFLKEFKVFVKYHHSTFQYQFLMRSSKNRVLKFFYAQLFPFSNLILRIPTSSIRFPPWGIHIWFDRGIPQTTTNTSTTITTSLGSTSFGHNKRMSIIILPFVNTKHSDWI